MFVIVGRLPPHEDCDSMDVCLSHNYQHWEFCFYLFVKLRVENGTLLLQIFGYLRVLHFFGKTIFTIDSDTNFLKYRF